MTPAQSMLRCATGLNLSKLLIDRAVDKRLEVTGHADQQAYLAAITPAEMAELVELLVVPESWFYRDPQAFQAALEFIRERVRASSRPLRILSIPCAGGEEPYTIAMVLSDAGLAPTSYLIEAWDISAACIERAREGIYGRNAFRSNELDFRERHFRPIGDDAYRIDDALRQQIRFRQGNLLEFDASARRGHFDVIFCRNLLIYFDKPTSKNAIERLSALLADDGLLFAGYAEVPAFCHHGFTSLHYPQAFGLRKEAATASSPARRRPAALAPTALSASAASAAPAAPVALTSARAPRPRHHPAASDNSARPAPLSASAAVAAGAPFTALSSASAGLHTQRAGATATNTPAQLLEQARRLADLGQAEDAGQACRQCLLQAPDNAEAYFLLGLLSEQAGQPEQAAEQWRRCLYLQPEHYEALCHLALLAEQRNDSRGAAALKARAARIYQRQSGKTPEDRNA